MGKTGSSKQSIFLKGMLRDIWKHRGNWHHRRRDFQHRFRYSRKEAFTNNRHRLSTCTGTRHFRGRSRPGEASLPYTRGLSTARNAGRAALICKLRRYRLWASVCARQRRWGGTASRQRLSEIGLKYSGQHCSHLTIISSKYGCLDAPTTIRVDGCCLEMSWGWSKAAVFGGAKDKHRQVPRQALAPHTRKACVLQKLRCHGDDCVSRFVFAPCMHFVLHK